MELSPIEASVIQNRVIEVLQTVFDPEIPVNIYELGLIYDVVVNPSGLVHIRMTLTSPHCPAAQSMPAEIEEKVRALDGVADLKLDVVWDPPWTMEMMSEAAKLELGIW
jgi:FeS assembly SUF system protein